MSLQCREIQKSYGRVRALKSVSLQVNKGEIRAILGGNGSGKSTLAKIIGGAVTRDAGEMQVGGQAYEPGSPASAKKQKVVITSQELSLLQNITVAENICLCTIPTRGLFVDRRKTDENAMEMVRKLGMEHLLERNVVDLAANEKYLVEFLKALIQQPDILIVDEITSALYKKDVRLVDRILKELKAAGCIILFISHRMQELYDICDSVTVMRNGEVIETFQMNEVEEQTLLCHMAGKEVQQNSRKEQVRQAAAPTILKASGLRLKHYEHKSIDLDIKQGEIIGVAGLQGHGQSTLVRTLYGANGSISYELDGQKISIRNVTQAVKHGLAFISGDREGEGTFRDRSLSENVQAVSHSILKRKLKGAQVHELLENSNVVFDNPGQTITELSGGNQQKVVIARWTSVSPKVVFADDPTKGIDVNARREVHKIFYQLADNGSSVVMVSSDDKELVDMTRNAANSRVIVMYEGEISAILTGDEINESNISAASMNLYNKEATA